MPFLRSHRLLPPQLAFAWLRAAVRLVPRCGFAWIAVVAILMLVVASSSASRFLQSATVSWSVFVGARVALFAIERGACSVRDTLWLLRRETVPAAIAAIVVALAMWMLSGFSATFIDNDLPWLSLSPASLDPLRFLLPATPPVLYTLTAIAVAGLSLYLVARSPMPAARLSIASKITSAFSPMMISSGILLVTVLVVGLLGSALLPFVVVCFSSLMAVVYRDVYVPASSAGCVDDSHP